VRGMASDSSYGLQAMISTGRGSGRPLVSFPLLSVTYGRELCAQPSQCGRLGQRRDGVIVVAAQSRFVAGAAVVVVIMVD